MKGSGCALEKKLQRVKVGGACYSIRIVGDSVYYGIEDGIYEGDVGQRLWVRFGIEQGAISLGCCDGGGVAHVMLERLRSIMLSLSIVVTPVPIKVYGSGGVAVVGHVDAANPR